MKKLLSITIAYALLTVFSSAVAQDNSGWIIGKWKGFVVGQRNDWTLEIKPIDKTTIIDAKESSELKGSFRFKEGNPGNISLQLVDNRLVFRAWGKEDYSLVRITDQRMEGTKKNPDGKEYQIRFWKLNKQGTGIDDAKNSPFFGVWEGFWMPGPKGHYTIEYVDDTAATINYRWDSKTDDWEWWNVSISSNGEFRVGPDKRYMVYKLSKNRKYLEGEIFNSGSRTSSISAGKLVEETEKLLKPSIVELPLPQQEPKQADTVLNRDDIIAAFSGKTLFFEKWRDNDNGVEIKVYRDGFAEVEGKKYAWTVDDKGIFCTSKKEWEDEGKRDVFYGCKQIVRLGDGSLYSKSVPARSGKIIVK